MPADFAFQDWINAPKRRQGFLSSPGMTVRGYRKTAYFVMGFIGTVLYEINDPISLFATLAGATGLIAGYGFRSASLRPPKAQAIDNFVPLNPETASSLAMALISLAGVAFCLAKERPVQADAAV